LEIDAHDLTNATKWYNLRVKNFAQNKPKHPNPDEPVGAKRKSRFIGELKIEDCKLNIGGKNERTGTKRIG
jgi:hypothetical protein